MSGRPKKSNDEKRTIKKLIAFTPEENILLEKKAKEAGVSISAYIRMTLFEKDGKEQGGSYQINDTIHILRDYVSALPDPKNFYEAVKELQSIDLSPLIYFTEVQEKHSRSITKLGIDMTQSKSFLEKLESETIGSLFNILKEIRDKQDEVREVAGKKNKGIFGGN